VHETYLTMTLLQSWQILLHTFIMMKEKKVSCLESFPKLKPQELILSLGPILERCDYLLHNILKNKRGWPNYICQFVIFIRPQSGNLA